MLSATQSPPLLHGSAFRLELLERLGTFDRQTAEDAGRHAAVVLLVIADDEGRASVVITRRAAKLRQHSGQFALPGGKLDDGETIEMAALRELEEEVGVRLGGDAILGLMDDYVTRSGFVITPVVVWGDGGTELRPDPGEVAETYVISLEELARKGAVRTCRMPGSEKPLLALAILGTFVFAPTAAVLHQFAELAVHARSTSVLHFDQPRFAWR